MADMRLEGDLHVTGNLSAGTMQIPNGAIADAQVAPDAGIEATKYVQRHTSRYAQESGTAAADEARVVHTVIGATGTLKSFHAGAVVANVGNAIVEVDLLKNGVSILVSKIELNSTHEAREVIAGDIDTISLVADDVLEVSIDATVGTGTLAKGVFAHVVLDEQPA